MKKMFYVIIAITMLVSGCLDDRTSDEDYMIDSIEEVTEETQEKIEDVTEVSDEVDEVIEEVIEEDVCIDFPLFEFAPVDLERTTVLLPLGLMTGSHVTPIDHHYFQNFANEGYNIEVYSPADGVIVSVQHMPGAPVGYDYRLVIDHGCGISSVYIHLGTFSDEFADLAPEKHGEEYFSPNVKVKAGQLIGYYEINIDYNIVDESVTLEGFVNPDSYRAERWKTHIPENTYAYFTEDIQNQLLEISLRNDEPISGKIDYDIEGYLVGNWFLEGTNGYAGITTATEGYWMGHLAIAYDAYDPSKIMISIGGYEGSNSRQFAVLGNSPDPSTISKESGIVKYLLVDYVYLKADGDYWDRITYTTDITLVETDQVRAIVLFEVLDSNKLKMEVFETDNPDSVIQFTENHVIYER